MTTEGIGGGILHDVGMNLIKKGFSAIKSKIPVPEEELESMLKDYQGGGAKRCLKGWRKGGIQRLRLKCSASLVLMMQMQNLQLKKYLETYLKQRKPKTLLLFQLT